MNAGDKVRVLNTDYPNDIAVGDVVKIVSVGEHGVDLFHEIHESLYFYFSEVEEVVDGRLASKAIASPTDRDKLNLAFQVLGMSNSSDEVRKAANDILLKALEE